MGAKASAIDIRCPSCDVQIAAPGSLPTKCPWCKQTFPPVTRQQLDVARRAQVAEGTRRETSETSNLLARLRGAAMVTIGTVAGLGCFYFPLMAAIRGESSIPYWFIMIAMSPALVAHGGLLLIFGTRAWGMIQDSSRKPTRFGWMLGIASGGLGAVLALGMWVALQRLGYEMSR